MTANAPEIDTVAAYRRLDGEVAGLAMMDALATLGMLAEVDEAFRPYERVAGLCVRQLESVLVDAAVLARARLRES